jgi:hydroxypyruvate isomerase
MIRFAANLSMLFTELPFLDRIQAAATAGFQAVECQFPYLHEASAIRDALASAGVPMVLHNIPAGDWAAGERGIACHPKRINEFRAGVLKAIQYAQVLDVPKLNCLAGLTPSDASPADIRATFVANLRFAAQALQDAGLKLVVEPINPLDVPGFWLNRVSETLQLLAEAGHANAYVQLDVFHAHRMGDDAATLLLQHAPKVGHVQIADTPQRHEPGTGDVPWARVWDALHRSGYSGWVGCEYNPKAGTVAGLGWRHGAVAVGVAAPSGPPLRS